MRPGTRIGAYEVVSALGSGGAGSVFRARSGQGAEVAVKLLHKCDEESQARFDREQRLLGSFGEAEGFVPLLDVGAQGAHPFLVMPLLRGGTLRRYLDEGPLPVAEVIALGTKLARALGKAHARGVVHRDVKPENVLFAHGDLSRPLVSDLGLAKHFSRDKDVRSLSLSKTGVFRGTAGYMPPEQMQDGKSVGPPADVFALGAVLYECLAGRPPFVGETPFELFAAVTNGTPEPLARVRGETPAWLAAVVEKALQRAPAKRFQDGEAMARALEEGAKGLSRPRSGALPLALGGVGVALLAAAGAFFAFGRSAPSSAPASTTAVVASTTVPTPTPPRERDLRDGFREGPGWKLRDTWGRYDWKVAAGYVVPALTADATRAAAASQDGCVRVFDTANGHELWCTRGSFAPALAFSPSGDRLLVGYDEGKPRIVDARTGAPLVALEGHAGPTNATAWLPGGDKVVTAGGVLEGEDGASVTIRVWDAKSGALLDSFNPRIGLVQGIAVTNGGERVVATGNAGAVIVKELGTEKEPVRLLETGRLVALGATPDGRLAVTANNDTGWVTLWDIENGARMGQLGTKHEHEAFAAAVSADGRTIVTGGREAIRFYSVAPAPVVVAAPRTPSQRKLVLTPDGKRALSGHEDGTLRFWDATKGVELGVREGLDGPVRSLAVAKGGVVAASNTDAWLVAAGPGLGQPFARELDLYLWPPALSRDGSVLLVIKNEHPNRHLLNDRFLVDLKRRELRWQEKDVKFDALAIAVSNDARFGLITDRHGSVGYLDLASGDRGAICYLEGPARALAFLDAAGQSWIAGGENGTVTFGGLQGDMARPIEVGGKHGAQVNAAAAGGGSALTGDEKGHVFVWDVRSHSKLRDFPIVHGARVAAVAVSPDGKLGASASDDGTVALWDLVKFTRSALIELASSADRPTALLFESDRVLRVGTARGVVHAFDLAR